MRWLSFIQELFCGDIIEERNYLSLDNRQLQDKLDEKKIEIGILKSDLVKAKHTMYDLKKSHEMALMELKSDTQSQILEYFWNNKIKPVEKLYYPARNGNSMDVLRYYRTQIANVPEVQGLNNDFKANNALKWVKNNIVYTTDPKENWQWADETIARKKGDCEDGAILMANIMLKSGIPYWRIRLNAGDVKGGGHAYVTYLREEDNIWYVLDWCYWYEESVNFKKTWSKAKKYFGIWFSWNNKYGFKRDKLDRQ